MAKKAETAAAVTDCFDEDAARYVTDFVSLLKASGTGRPIALMPWQVDAIEPFYGTMRYDETGALIRRYQYLYLEIPKKNGKSELAAALGLYHLVADGELNGEVYVCAADRDNASIIFDAAVYMVESNSALKKRLRLVLSQRTIYDPITGSKMKVISSEAYSKHGYKPSCVIFDELHSQRNRELWDIMTFGAGSARRQPVWIVLTTAGKDPERRSIGWEIHLRARGILDYRSGKRGKGITDYETWLPFIYGLPDDPEEVSKLDIYDEALWHRVNPGLGITVKLSAVREEAKAARASESAELLFRWLRLNQWVSDGTVGWLPVYLYDKTQWHGEASSLLGKTCYGGLDLSTTTDLTAFVLLFPPQDGVPKWTVLFRAWMPDSDLDAREKRDYAPYGDWYRAGFLTRCVGDTIDFDDVQKTILQAAADYKLKTLGVDPYLSRMMTMELMRNQVAVVEIPQDMKNLSPAMKLIETLLRKRQMEHQHNTCCRSCFIRTRCAVDGNENKKPMKNKSTGRIDLVVAWIIAMAAALLDERAPDMNRAVEAYLNAMNQNGGDV